MKTSQCKKGEKSVLNLLENLQPEVRTRMCKLFDVAYEVAKLEIPFTKYKALIEMETKHGVSLGKAYSNHRACQRFIIEIGRTMVDEMKANFDEGPFCCSIIFDGSSDKTYSEKEVVSIKYLKDGVRIS